MFRLHALQRMFERGISVEDTAGVVAVGEVLQEYPEDKPYPSRLVLGWCKNRPLHVVCADNSNAGETIIITVYEPDSKIWEPDFRSKRP